MFFLILAINLYSFSKESKKADFTLYQNEINSLNQELMNNDIPENWLLDNIKNPKFLIYDNIKNLFKNMSERRVSSKEKDFEWYKDYIGLDIKIKNAYEFIPKYIDLLKNAEKKHGIHYELIIAIFGIETNFARAKSLGNFYVFSALFSQYLFMETRRKWAAQELISLYHLTKKTNKDTYYYIGSFAGASGGAQFVPSSHLKYFVDSEDNDNNIDIYSIEDNIMSIENYLYYHGLNKDNIDIYANRYSTVYEYNRSNTYVQGVLYIYDALRKNRNDKNSKE